MTFSNGGSIAGPAVTFNNAGLVTLQSGSSSALSFTNAITNVNGNTAFLGNVQTTGMSQGMSFMNATFNGTANLLTPGGAIGIGGTTTFNGTGNTITIDSTNGNAVPAGANVSFTGALNGDDALNVYVGASGIASFGSNIGNATALASLTVAGQLPSGLANSISFSGADAFTQGGVINLVGPVTIAANVTFNSARNVVAGNNIIFASTITGAHTLTLNAGTGGAISVADNVNVSAIALTNSNTTSFNGTSVTTTGTVTISASTTSVTFNSVLAINNLTVTAGTYAIAINNGGTIGATTNFHNTGGVALMSGSSSSFSNGGLLTSTSSTNTFLGNIATSTGGMTLGAVNFLSGANSLTTPGGTISFSGAVTTEGIGNTLTIDTTNGNAVPAGNNITFSSTLDGDNTVSLNSGTANPVTCTGAVGSIHPLQTLTLSSGGTGATFDSSLAADVLAIQTGSTNVDGAVQLNSLALTLGTYNIGFLGGGSVMDATVFTNTGTVTFGNTTAADLTFVSGVDTFSSGTVSSTNIEGQLNTNNAAMNLGAVALNGNSTLTTSGGNLEFHSTIEGTGSGGQSLTLSTGSGPLFFDALVGNSVLVGNVNIASAASVDVGANIQLSGTFTQSGGGAVSMGANLTTANQPIYFSGPITLANPVTISSQSSPGAGNITFGNTIDGLENFIANAGTGTLTLDGAIGGMTPLNAIAFHGTTIVQNAEVKGVGDISYNSLLDLEADITSTTGDITINSNVLLSNSATITATAGNVTINGTVNAESTSEGLTVNASGAVTFASSIGTTGPLYNLEIPTANVVNFDGNIGTVLSTGIVNDITVSASSTINFFGTLYNANNQSYTLPTPLAFFNIDSVGLSGFTAQSGTINFSNGTIQIAPGTSLGILTFNVPVTLSNVESLGSGNLSIQTGNGAIAVGNLGNLESLGIVTLTGGSVTVIGPIDANQIQFATTGDITDPGGFTVTTLGFASEILSDTLGAVGTASAPFVIVSLESPVFVGSPQIAYLAGITVDNTIHAIPDNAPPLIYFNGEPVYVNPSPTPTPRTPAQILRSTPGYSTHLYYVVGIYSPAFNLSDDFYFFPEQIDDSYLDKKGNRLYRTRKKL
jgi:hypothetical protein